MLSTGRGKAILEIDDEQRGFFGFEGRLKWRKMWRWAGCRKERTWRRNG
jgi:hypothetical protein